MNDILNCEFCRTYNDNFHSLVGYLIGYCIVFGLLEEQKN